MGMLGSFLGGAAVGAVALGALAGFYCNFFNPQENISDSFASLEKADIEGVEADESEAHG